MALFPILSGGLLKTAFLPLKPRSSGPRFIAVAFALIAVVQGESFRIPRAAMAAFAGQAIATLVISVSYLASVQFIPIGLAVIIFFTFPVLIMLASPVVEGKFPGFLRIIIAVFAFGGLVVAIGPSFGDLDIRGIGLATLASLGGVVQFFTGRSISRYLTPAVFGSLVHIVIWPATLLVALYVSGGTLQMMPGGAGTATGFYFLLGVAGVYVAGLYAANVFPALCARFNRCALLQSGADCHHGLCRAAVWRDA